MDENIHSRDLIENLIPIEEVINDMMHEDSSIAKSARRYYYRYYATPEEREKMDAEDRTSRRWMRLFLFLYGMILATIIIFIIKRFI